MNSLSKRLFSVLAALSIFSLIAAPAFAEEQTIFGPKQYTRTTGPTNVYTCTFPAAPGEGSLIVKNGDENGKKRISSALIFLNGEQVEASNKRIKHTSHSLPLFKEKDML